MFLISFFLVLGVVVALDAVRMPISQVDPEVMPPITGFDPPIWVQTGQHYANTKYCHHYPDIMCYRRDGNGFTPGDAGLWLLSSETDRSGLGSIRVRFPQPVDVFDDVGQPNNGWFHPDCSHPVAGVRVFLTSFSPGVRFGSNAHLLYVGDIPMARWSEDLYVEYDGKPLTRHYFALRRMSIFDNVVPPPYYDPPPPVYEEPQPTHSDL